ncbi:MAG TPA: hypothetical protein VGO07_01255 [Candidatus Saccharimonadales bacterium]|jgi:hypothetical protein|nr:hypothetical protein [Candidatus Saccharimonadales bacterium]
MAEGYPAETESMAADYQAALESFLVETAAAMDQQAQWVVWAARSGFATDTISGYNNLLLQTAELNKQAVQSLVFRLGEQALSVWIDEPGQEPSRFVGLQYTIGDPSYRVGLMQGNERTYVPFRAAQHRIQIREPQQAVSPAISWRESSTALTNAVALPSISSERFDPSAHLNGPFRTPSPPGH